MNIQRPFRLALALSLGLGLSVPNPFAQAQTTGAGSTSPGSGTVPATPSPAAPAATPDPTPTTATAKDSPTNGSAATPSNAKNIRFQFDGIPYADVIERFAQMSGKPVVGELNIPGTITFNDSNAYNYAEAFDTLNVILSMKGQMIVEEGNFLRVLPFKELPRRRCGFCAAVTRQTGSVLARW